MGAFTHEWLIIVANTHGWCKITEIIGTTPKTSAIIGIIAMSQRRV